MGYFYAKDGDGLVREFVIEGDAPTPLEQSRIDIRLKGGTWNNPARQEEPETGILGNFGRGVERGFNNLQASGYTALQGLSHATGEPIFGTTEEQYGRLADEQRKEREETQLDNQPGGFLDQEGAYNKLKYLSGAAGQSAIDTVGGLGGMVAGTVAGGAVGGPAGALVGGLAGGLLPIYPSMLNENIEAQVKEHGRVKDWGKAAGSALANSAVETTTDRITLGVGGVFKKAAGPLLKETVKEATDKALTIAAKRIGATAAISTLNGSIEEVLQNISTRWQAEQNLMDDAAKKDYIESAIVGGILEGAFGIGIGTYGATKEAKANRAERDAINDAEVEGIEVSRNSQTNPPLYEKARDAATRAPTFKAAGLIEDRSTIEAPDHLVSEPFADPEKSHFSEEEYQAALESVRGEKKVSLDKLRKATKTDAPKAKRLFDEMLKRGDAGTTGSASQYLRVKPARDYIVRPIEEADAAPYKVSIKGKERGEAFKTEQEAVDWANRANVGKFDIVSTKPKGYGVYELQSESTTGEKKLVGKRLVKAFDTPEQANEAAREYDPKFSAKTNERHEALQQEDKARRVNEAARVELGPLAEQLQNFADSMVGKNRAKIDLVPIIDRTYLKLLGVADADLPKEGQVVEGLTTPSKPDVKKAVRNLVALSSDLNSPSLSEDQKLQKLREVLTHEIVHVMRNLDLLKRDEWDGLFKHALSQKVPGKTYTWMQAAAARNPEMTKAGESDKVSEEALAEMLRYHLRNPTALTNPQRSMMKKLADFIRKLLRLGARHDANDVMKAIFGGEVAGREVGSGGLGQRNYPGTPFFSTVKVPGFYMKSDKFFSNLKQETATKEHWLNLIKPQTSGIRQEELDWLGLEDFIRDTAGINPNDAIEFLAGQSGSNPDYVKESFGFTNDTDYIQIARRRGWNAPESKKVSRGEILDYIRANGVDLQERTSQPEDAKRLPLQDTIMEAWANSPSSSFEEFIGNKEYPPELEPVVRQHMKDVDTWHATKGAMFEPEYHDTTQKGGDNYREFLFILPKIGPEFEHNHWQDKNVVAHARTTDRDLGDGKRTLFIEEVQSDLHQQGRKKGYMGADAAKRLADARARYGELDKERKALNDEFNILYEGYFEDFAKDIFKRQHDGEFSMEEAVELLEKKKDAAGHRMNNEISPRLAEILDQQNEALEIIEDSESAVPDAPFKGTWEELVFKRMVRHAVDRGYDQIAWHGSPESVAASEHYPGIVEGVDADGKKTYSLARHGEVYGDVTPIVNRYLKKLTNYASKTFKKFNTGPEYRNPKTSTERLPLNEYFLTLYDWDSFDANYHQYIPTEYKEKFKHLSQVVHNQRRFDVEDAVEKVGFPKDVLYDFIDTFDDGFLSGTKDETKSYPKWVMPISDELRASVETEGLPLFSMTDAKKRELLANDNFKAWFKKSKVVGPDGLPMVVYHGTRASNNFSSFYAMSHFGTANAAHDRMDAIAEPVDMMEKIADSYNIARDNMLSWWWKLPPAERQDLIRKHSFDGKITERHHDMRVYPVFLSIQKPLDIMDDGVLENLDDYKGAVLDALQSGPEWNPMAYVANAPLINRVVKATNLLSLIKPLEEAGYDGFRYINQAEDIGSTSWVAFRPEQIKSIWNRGTWNPRDRRIDYSAVSTNINTPAFREWFRDSKIVDAEGQPMIMYHGTVTDFDHFGKEAGRKVDDGWYGKGFYFTPNPELASHYTGRSKKVNITSDWKNIDPNFPPDPSRRDKPFGISVLKDFTGGNIMPVFLSVKNPYIWPAEKAPLMFLDDSAAFSRDLQRQGYDGVIVPKGTHTEVVVFKPQQVKSIYNRGTWSPRDPRVDYSMVTPQYAATAPLGQRVPITPPQDRLADIEGKITYNNLAPVLQKLGYLLPAKAKYKYEKGVEGTFIALQDRMLSVGKLIDRMKANGGFISNENDTYLREQLFTGQTDAAIQDGDKDYYTPLVKRIASLAVTKADAEEAGRMNGASRAIIENYKDHKKGLAELYLYAQHAVERNAEMRKRNVNLQTQRQEQYDYGSGMADGEARQILDWFNLKPFGPSFNNETDPTSVRSLFRTLIANTNDIRVRGGLNPDFRKMTREDGTPVDVYRDYAPLRSWIDEHADPDEEVLAFARAGKGYNIQGKEDFSATGRSSIASNIIENAILQNEEAIVRAGKNVVGNSFLKLLEDNPDSTDLKDVAEIIARKKRKVTYDRKKGVVRMVPDNSMWNDPSILKVKRSGQQVYIKIHDERIARALNSKSALGNIGLGPISKMMLGLNRFLAMTRTSLNPEFMVSNMLRDLEQALANISELDIKGFRRQLIRDVPGALNGVRHALRTGDMTTEWAKTFHEFRKMGGMTAFYGIRDLDSTLQKVQGLLKEDLSGANPRKVLKALKGLGKFVEDYNLAIENGTRLSAYKNMRDAFLSMSSDPKDPKNIKRAQELAASKAKNLTVNFNAGGELKPFMNAWWLFFNAGIQGSMALVNPMIRSKKVRRIWGSVLLAGVMQDILMSMFSPEDDDGEKTYDKIPQYILEHNFVMMDPFGLSERGYFKIPLPYLMNGIFNTGRSLARMGRGKYSVGEAFNTIGGTLLDSINPWGGSNSFLNFVAPTVVDPIVDLSQNENFASEPIAPPENPFGLNEKASQRYWNNTSPAAVTIADWLSRLTLSEGDYLGGGIEVSPNQLQYLYDWLAGGTGTFVQRSAELVSGKNVLEQMITGGEWSANDVPIIRRAYGNVTTKNDLQSYIAGRDDVLRVRSELKDAVKDGDTERYQRIMEDHRDEYRAAVTINKIENARKKYSSRIKKIRESRVIPDDRKEAQIKALKERQDALVGRANRILSQIR